MRCTTLRGRDVGRLVVILSVFSLGSADCEDSSLGKPGEDPPPPSVDAGPDQTVEVGDTVVLSGGSESLGSHKWELLSTPAGSAAVISDELVLSGASFVADQLGEYEVELRGAVSSNPTAPDTDPLASDTVLITAVSQIFDECPERPAGAVTFDEQEFDPALWSVSESVTMNGDAIATAEQALSGGADGAYRTMTHRIVNPSLGAPGCDEERCSFTLVVTHHYDSASYDPAMTGAVDFIDYSETHIITQPAFEGAAVGWNFAVWQDGTRYILDPDERPTDAFTNLTWVGESRCGLTPGDFTPEGLDFGGSELTFGFIRSNSNTSPDSIQRNVHGIDNFRVVVVPAAP